MKWLLSIVALVVKAILDYRDRRRQNATDRILKEIARQEAYIQSLDDQMSAWLSHHGAHAVDFAVLQSCYIKACADLRRLRARLPEGHPSRSV